jgi:hypothetical protein
LDPQANCTALRLSSGTRASPRAEGFDQNQRLQELPHLHFSFRTDPVYAGVSSKPDGTGNKLSTLSLDTKPEFRDSCPRACSLGQNMTGEGFLLRFLKQNSIHRPIRRV